ncbi:MAG: hypothetical protein KatS3mg118_2898 [Paracoccaceae bacterium]|nr:MAG: hypothetical protein KatS3mg118_2898 [Paracoccaceae bacterium]
MIRLDDLVLQVGGFRLAAACGFPAGTITALIGPSGAGKSTLLAALAGFLAPMRGRIVIAGRDMAGVPPALRPVSILFQDHNLFPHLTALQNAGLGISPDLRLSAAQRAEAEAALAAMGLAGLEGRRPAQLSGGQRQRVALARALLRRRPVLLLDEPFAGLGPGLRKEMLDLVASVARGARPDRADGHPSARGRRPDRRPLGASGWRPAAPAAADRAASCRPAARACRLSGPIAKGRARQARPRG